MFLMLTEEHRKEALSRAYVQAVGAKAGVIVGIKDRGYDYGIDGSFHEVSLMNGRRTETGIALDFQLKATTCIDTREEFIYYSLDADTINLLASRTKRANVSPAILIVLSLPSQPDEWIQLSEKELILRNCCYWTFISSLTNNLYSATVKIPRSQLFTPEALHDLLEKISNRTLV